MEKVHRSVSDCTICVRHAEHWQTYALREVTDTLVFIEYICAISTYTYTQIHLHPYIFIHKIKHTPKSILIHPTIYAKTTNMHIRTNTNAYTQIQTHAPKYKRIHPNTNSCTQIQTHAPKYKRMHPNTNAYTQIQTHAPKCKRIHPNTNAYY